MTDWLKLVLEILIGLIFFAAIGNVKTCRPCILTRLKSSTHPFRFKNPGTHGSYYWQPFSGRIPHNAFEVGRDRNGEMKYIARVMFNDGRSSPTTISESILGQNALYFGYEGQSYTVIQRYVEIMCVDRRDHGLVWRHVSTREQVRRFQSECCLVVGGYSYQNGQRMDTYVGRTYALGSYFIGGVYINDWNRNDYFHYMDGWHAQYIESNYGVLAYDCCEQIVCSPHSWYYYNHPCCANYYGRSRQLRGFLN